MKYPLEEKEHGILARPPARPPSLFMHDAAKSFSRAYAGMGPPVDAVRRSPGLAWRLWRDMEMVLGSRGSWRMISETKPIWPRYLMGMEMVFGMVLETVDPGPCPSSSGDRSPVKMSKP